MSWLMILVLGPTEWKRLGKVRSKKTREQPETQTEYCAEACALLYPFELTSETGKACWFYSFDRSQNGGGTEVKWGIKPSVELAGSTNADGGVCMDMR